ncbi:Calcium-transporting ATPase 9, plasma membrane-type, partial [Morella rubra]
DSEVHIHWKGAAELVLASCNGYLDSNGCLQSIEEDKDFFKAAIHDMAASSLRCVAIAYRLYDSDKVPVDVEQLAQWILPEDSLVLLAIVGMKDPCRPGVKDAVKICSDAGVKVRMVTGDNLETAKAIAFECGILTSSQDAIEPYIIEGRTFRALSEKEREATAKKITVMGRSSPNDKLLLVQALRKGGEVVAVTGDGTNDAPALHEADIGLSMGIQGTEVAKESSDIIILDDNFASVVKDRFGIAGVCLTLEMSLFNRCFRIESKEFHVRISEKGDLLFSEWSSRSVNEIHMGKYGAVWMVNMSDKLMVASTAVDFASKFTESRRGFLAQRCCNKGGRYIAVVEYGGRRKVGAVLVPEGKHGHGWQILNRVFLEAVSCFRSASLSVNRVESSRIRPEDSFAKVVLAPAVVHDDGGRSSAPVQIHGLLTLRTLCTCTRTLKMVHSQADFLFYV